MEMMRNSRFNLTMEIYTHVAPRVTHAGVEEIDAVLRASAAV